MLHIGADASTGRRRIFPTEDEMVHRSDGLEAAACRYPRAYANGTQMISDPFCTLPLAPPVEGGENEWHELFEIHPSASAQKPAYSFPHPPPLCGQQTQRDDHNYPGTELECHRKGSVNNESDPPGESQQGEGRQVGPQHEAGKLKA